jgi:hypothetical protein
MERHFKGTVGLLREVDASGQVKGPRGINDGAGF